MREDQDLCVCGITICLLYCLLKRYRARKWGVIIAQDVLHNTQVHQSKHNGKLITAYINLHIK